MQAVSTPSDCRLSGLFCPETAGRAIDPTHFHAAWGVCFKSAQGCFLIALAGCVDAFTGTVWLPFVQRADPNPTAIFSPSFFPFCVGVRILNVWDVAIQWRWNRWFCSDVASTHG